MSAEYFALVQAIAHGIGSNAGWDAAKGGWKALRSRLRAPSDSKLEETFAALEANEFVKRRIARIVAAAIRRLPDKQRELTLRSFDAIGDAIYAHLTEDTDGHNLLAAIREASENTSLQEEHIASLTTAMLVHICEDRFVMPLALLSEISRGFQNTSKGLEDLRSQNDQILAFLTNSGPSTAGSGLRTSPQLSVPQIDLLANYANEGIVDVKVAPSSVFALAPPDIPETFVERTSVYNKIATSLSDSPVIAITGYPESGKTLAVAGYVRRSDRRCLWCEIPRGETDSAVIVHMLCFKLAKSIGCDSLERNRVADALIAAAREVPILLVLDNVELIADCEALGFLTDAIVNSNGRLQCVLLVAQVPQVIHTMPLSVARPWKLPGMNAEEACELYQKLGVEITAPRRKAIDIVCARSDGHVGMLRHSRREISNVQTDADAVESIAPVSRTTDTSAFLELVTAHFFKSLSPEDRHLCTCLTIPFSGVPRTLANTLWALVGDTEGFDISWIRCKSTILENKGNDRYQLPYLYRAGLRGELDDDKALALHHAAGRYLVEPQRGVLSVDDLYYGILHLIAAQEWNAAILYGIRATVASRTQEPGLSVYIFRLLKPILIPLLGEKEVDSALAMQLLNIFMWLAREEGFDADVITYAAQIRKLLPLADLKPSELYLTHMGLLLTASDAGDIQLALFAFDGCISARTRRSATLTKAFGPLVLLHKAYTNAHSSFLEFLEEIAQRLESRTVPPTHLWAEPTNRHDWFSLWSSVAETIYSELFEEGAGTEGLTRFRNVAARLKNGGPPELSCILDALDVVLEVDLCRNFESAVTKARSLVASATCNDPNVLGRTYEVLADALRCAGKDTEAVAAYESAIRVLPPSSVLLPACWTSLGITLGKLGNYVKAIESLRCAARHQQLVYDEPFNEARARIWLEAAVAALHAGQRERSLACLIVAHKFLATGNRHSRFWVVLGQVASALTSNLEESENQAMPVCGFSYGLPQQIAGAEEMQRAAPTMMLSTACSATRFKRRAFLYAESAFSEIDDDVLKPSVAFHVFSCAVSTKDLQLISRGAALALSVKLDQIPPVNGIRMVEVVDGFLFHEALTALASYFDDGRTIKDAVHEYTAAHNGGNDLSQLLQRGFVATLNASEGHDEALEAFYSDCVDRHFYNSARDAAWLWCFRWLPHNSTDIAHVTRWFWRLAALALATSQNDQYLGGLMAAIRRTWSQLVIGDDHLLNTVKLAVFSIHPDARTELLGIDSAITLVAPSALGWRTSLDEVAKSPSNTILERRLDTMLASWLPAVVDDLFQSVPERVSDINDGLDQCREVLSGLPTRTEPWASGIRRLQAIASALQSQSFTSDVANDLLDFEEQYSIRTPRAQNAWRAIKGAALQVVTNDTLDSLRDLGLTVLYQSRAPIPIPNNLVREVTDRISNVLEKVQFLVLQLEAYDRDASHHSDAALLRWPVLMSLGRAKFMCAEFQERVSLPEECQLGYTHDDAARHYEAAADIGANMDSPSWASIASTSLGIILNLTDKSLDASKRLADGVAYAEKANDPELLRVATMLRDAPLEVAVSVLYGEDLANDDNESVAIQAEIKRIALGLPEDRLIHIVDDFRKQIRFARARREFCRHLIPTPGLHHGSSHDTAYLVQTDYTMECAILYRKTLIPSVDAETAITSMQRNFCEGCDKREPGHERKLE